MRLYSSVIKLTNLHPVTLIGDGGQHAHGAFYAIIAKVDPALARYLHDELKNKRKPFTLSPLMGLPKSFRHEGKIGDEAYLRDGWQCWLRVTILDDTLFKTFIDYFMDPNPSSFQKAKWRGTLPEIRLGDAHFCVSEILTTPGSHPWAGYSSVDDLQEKLDEPAPQKFKFELFTVTSFKMQNENVETLPKPERVFGNLAGAWRQLTGENHVQIIEEYAEKNLVAGNYHLKMERTLLHNNHQLGAVGQVEFIRTNKEDTPTARALNLLADLAFYTGLGRKTTHGMGMCSRVVG